MSTFFSIGRSIDINEIPSLLSIDLSDRFYMANDPDWLNEYKYLSWQWSRIADERFQAVSEFHPQRKPLLRIGIKDNINCEGFSTKLGTRHYRQYPKNSAKFISMIDHNYFTCKTQLTEVTLGRNAGCLNPKYNFKWSGASSTGSAVAVAANICDLAIGTDSLGSVRIPAAACGIVSMKMTNNPAILEGILPVSKTFDSVGWFARTIKDLSFAFSHLNILKTENINIDKYKIGICKEVINDKHCIDHVLESYGVFFSKCNTNTIEFVPFSLSEILWNSRMDSWRLCAYEANKELSPYKKQLEFSRDVENVLSLGASISDAKAIKIKMNLIKLKISFEQRIKSLGLHAFILPVYPFEIPTNEDINAWEMLFPNFGDSELEPFSGYAPIASMLGWPALTIPSFMFKYQLNAKIQTAFQIVTIPYHEHILLDIASKLQKN